MHTAVSSTTAPTPIAIVGAGRIGLAIAHLLRTFAGADYAPTLLDSSADSVSRAQALGLAALHVPDEAALARALAGQWAALNALPFHQAPTVAALCVAAGVHYLDLTEDVASTQAIRTLAQGAQTLLMPQCGLAPGFISILGNALAQRFERLHRLHLRVGALPQYPQGLLGYNLTWSTEGLINEYCNPCEVIMDGQLRSVAAMSGLEPLHIGGVQYEAFNTSGGLGSLVHSRAGRVHEMNYKTLRFPGHCAAMRLLLDELGLRQRRDVLRDLLEKALPGTQQDQVIVFASASGERVGAPGRLEQESFATRTVNADIAGLPLSAIQRTTAGSICAVLDLLRAGRLPTSGFVAQEQVALEAFLANRFGAVYAAVGETAAM